MLHGTAENRIPRPAPQPRVGGQPRAGHQPRHRKPEELAIAPVGDAAGRSYEDLYVEHAPAARRVALSMVPRDVADDIVAEAFTRVLSAIRAGGGPGLAFRAYLLTAVRNTANDWLRASRRTTAVGDVEHDLDEQRVPEENLSLARLSRGPEAEAEARAEARLVAQAFAKLPSRWQAVLWQLEVEAKAPAAIAPMFGLSANGVSALAVRAREGLRQAYLTEHVGANIPAACRTYAEALSAGTRGRLSRRRQAAVHDHLTQCASCHSLAGELTELNSRLGAILTPAALAAALGAGGNHLLPIGGAQAGAAAGARAGLGAKLGTGAKAAVSGHWRAWKLHPLTSAATATAGLAAAGGMVVAVSVSPLSPFHGQPVGERPAASSAQASAPALSPAGSATGGSAAGASAAGIAAGATSAALGALTPAAAASGLVSPAAGGATSGTGRAADTMTPSGRAGQAAGLAAPGASPRSSSSASVGSLVQNVGQGVGSTVRNVGQGAGSTVAGVGQGVNALAQAVGVTLGTTTSGLGTAVGAVTGSPALGSAGGAGGAASGVVQGAGGTAGNVTGAVGGTVGGATGAVGNTVNGATGAAGGLLGGKKS